jgi:hypothetical protein
MCHDLVAAGARIAAVSNACGEYVRAVLNANDVGEMFEVQFGADEVPAAKPAPDGLLLCAYLMGVDPTKVAFLSFSCSAHSQSSENMKIVSEVGTSLHVLLTITSQLRTGNVHAACSNQTINLYVVSIFQLDTCSRTISISYPSSPCTLNFRPTLKCRTLNLGSLYRTSRKTYQGKPFR